MNASLLPRPRPAGLGRSLSGRAVALLVLAVVMGLLQLVHAAAPANADEVCFLDADGRLSCPSDEPEPGPTYAPPELVNPRLLPELPEWAASVRRLEEQAVGATLRQHDLPPSDRDAVLSWARADALANLWTLLTRAAGTAEAERTVDQQRAVYWLVNLVRDHEVLTATTVGEEYVRWAGLDLTDYRRLVDSGAGRGELTAFLTTLAQPYSADRSTGYCTYRSPAPYAEEYQGYRAQTCFTPCSAYLCDAPRPSYDTFLRWGQAIANGSLTDSRDVLSAGAVASALTGTQALAAVTGGLAGAAAPPLAFSALGAYYFTVITPGLAHFDTLTFALPFLNGVVGSVLMAVAAVTTGIVAGINYFEELETPRKIAGLIVRARETTYDLAEVMRSADWANTLFALFGQATSPTPVADTTCDNSLIPVAFYGLPMYEEAPVLDPETGRMRLLSTIPCLNRTPVPDVSQTDPHFVVRSADTGEVTAQEAISVRLAGADGQADQNYSLRARGGWLVTQTAGGDAKQGLAVGLTGWNGEPRTVSIVRTEAGGYSFAGLTKKGFGGIADPDTCLVAGTCWSGPELHYIGADGTKYRAILVGPAIGSPTHSVDPTVNHPVTFDAGGFRTHGTTVPFYEWRFQTPGCTTPCTSPVVGETATFTWREPGTYQVQLSARSFGDWPSLVKTFEVKVQAGSPPLLTVDPDCGTTADVECSPRNWRVGSLTTLGARIDKDLPEDTEWLTVDWGDGRVDRSAHRPGEPDAPGPIRFGDLSATAFTVHATHTYATHGTYHGTVTVSDGFGQQTSLPFTETIEPKLAQTIAFGDLPNRRVGETFDISATGGGSANPVTFSSGTSAVCVSSGDRGQTIELVGVGTCVIYAKQYGDSTYERAAPARATFEVAGVAATEPQ